MIQSTCARFSSTDLVVEHSELRFRARELGRELLEMDDRDYRYDARQDALGKELEIVNAEICRVRQELRARGIIKGDNA
jgi:hypothetical protein